MKSLLLASYDFGLVSTEFLTSSGDLAHWLDVRNYKFVGSGGDGAFGTGNEIDRTGWLVNPVASDDGTTVSFSFASQLPDDLYRLTLNGTGLTASNGTALFPGDVVLTLGMNFTTPVTVIARLQPGSDSGASAADLLTTDPSVSKGIDSF